jgi:hypothetical protein
MSLTNMVGLKRMYPQATGVEFRGYEQLILEEAKEHVEQLDPGIVVTCELIVRGV